MVNRIKPLFRFKNNSIYFWIGFTLFISIKLLYLNEAYDDRLRLIGAINLLEGNGYYCEIFDIDSWSFDKLQLAPMWPILSSLLMVLVTKLTGNLDSSFYILEVIFSFIFLASFYRLLILYKSNSKIKFLFLLFCISPMFPIKVTSIDLYATAVATYGCYFFITNKDIRSSSLSFWLCTCVLFTLPALFRFNLYGTAYIPFIFLIIILIWQKIKMPAFSYFIAFIIPTLILLAQSHYTSSVSQDIVYIEGNTVNFNLRPLLLSKPFNSILLFGLDINILRAPIREILTKTEFDTVNTATSLFLVLTESIIILLILIKAIVYSKKKSTLIFLVLIIISVLAPIYILSICIQVIESWAFGSEVRYMAIATTLLLVLIKYLYDFKIIHLPKYTYQLCITVFLIMFITLQGNRIIKGRFLTSFKHQNIYSTTFKPRLPAGKNTLLLFDDPHYTGVYNHHHIPSLNVDRKINLTQILDRVAQNKDIFVDQIEFRSLSKVITRDDIAEINTSQKYPFYISYTDWE